MPSRLIVLNSLVNTKIREDIPIRDHIAQVEYQLCSLVTIGSGTEEQVKLANWRSSLSE